MDECIADTLSALLSLHQNKIWDKIFNYNDIKEYYIHNIPWVWLNQMEIVEYFRNTFRYDNDSDFTKIKPIKHSKNKLEELKSMWYNLKIVTARDEWLFEKYTKTWLEKYFPWIFCDVYFANHFSWRSRKKSEICLDIWASKMIEDNYDYALDTSSAWIETYLFNKPWNIEIKEINKIKRFDCWSNLKI